MHEHVNCHHNFKYCSKCDVVFCNSCRLQWEKPCNKSHWNNNWTFCGAAGGAVNYLPNSTGPKNNIFGTGTGVSVSPTISGDGIVVSATHESH